MKKRGRKTVSRAKKPKAKPRAKKQRKKVVTTTTTRTTRDTVVGRMGDLMRSQEEHVDAALVALEDGDCQRARAEYVQARSHGEVPHEATLRRQLSQQCAFLGNIDGLGKLPRKIRGRRGRPKHSRIKLPADAYIPDNKPPLPILIYIVGYPLAAFLAFKLLSSRKAAAAANGLGHADCGCGTCAGCSSMNALGGR